VALKVRARQNRAGRGRELDTSKPGIIRHHKNQARYKSQWRVAALNPNSNDNNDDNDDDGGSAADVRGGESEARECVGRTAVA